MIRNPSCIKSLPRVGFIILCLGFFGLAACTETPPDGVRPPNNSEWVMRGAHLVKGLAACGNCHGEGRSPQAVLTGGLTFVDRYGEVVAPNLTPHKDGLKSWSDDELLRVMRGGLTPDERQVSNEAHEGYQWMSDSDLFAIVAYLRTLPPLPGKTERRELGFIERNTTGFLDVQRQQQGGVADIPVRFNVARGKYLVDHVARCGSCHNSEGSLYSGEGYLAGGLVIKRDDEERIAPSLQSTMVTGLGSWSRDDLVRYLQTGETAEGRHIDQRFCPVGFYKNAEPTDLEDIASFLLNRESKAEDEEE